MSFIDSLVSHLGDGDIEADALPALVPAVIAAGVLIASADGAFEARELEEIDDEELENVRRRFLEIAEKAHTKASGKISENLQGNHD